MDFQDKELGPETLEWLNNRRRSKNPSIEKWLDARGQRRQMGLFSHKVGTVPYYAWWEITENGIPYWEETYYDKYRTKFFVAKWSRPNKFFRTRNGQMEWQGSGDAWGRPHVQGKSSRYSMKQKKVWIEEAYEAIRS